MRSVVLVAVSCLFIALSGYAGNGQIVAKAYAVSGRYIVTVNASYDIDTVRTYATQLGGTVGEVWYDAVFGFALQCSQQVATTLSQDARVTVVEEDATAPMQGSCPMTQHYPSQTCADGSIPWQLDAMDSSVGYTASGGGLYDTKHLDGAYTVRYTGGNVRIYFVDTGLSAHPDITGRIVAGHSFVNNGGATDNITDPHGTISASIAAGTYSGLAKNAELIAVRIPDSPKSSDWISAINWVGTDILTRNGAFRVVVNLPFQDAIGNTLDTAVLKLISRGAVVVSAAGNLEQGNNLNTCTYSPSHLSQVIVPGGLQQNGGYEVDKYAIASDIGAGACVTLMAPAIAVGAAHSVAAYNCNPGWSAASWACALTSGMAALYLERYPDSSPAQIKQLMLDNASYEHIAGNMRGAPMILLQVPPTDIVTTPENCMPCQYWVNGCPVYGAQ